MNDTYEVLTYPNSVLMSVAEPATDFGPDLDAVARKMLVTMYANDGIGLAANQVGILKRIVVIDTGLPQAFIDQLPSSSVHVPVRGRSPQILVNPVITHSSNMRSVTKESCLSFPGISQSVTRPNLITIRYQTTKGVMLEEQVSGLNAICVQHEIDHLNGITLAARMSQIKRKRLNKQLGKT